MYNLGTTICQEGVRRSSGQVARIERMCYPDEVLAACHGIVNGSERVQFINVRLLVSDFSAAYAFWRDVMRLPVKYGPEMEGMPPDYAYFQAGDEAGIELMPRASMAAALGEAEVAPVAADHQTALVFKVDDVDATYADLVARGAASVAGPREYAEVGIRTAHVADPDGHLIEVYCPLAAPEMPDAPDAPSA